MECRTVHGVARHIEGGEKTIKRINLLSHYRRLPLVAAARPSPLPLSSHPCAEGGSTWEGGDRRNPQFSTRELNCNKWRPLRPDK